MTSAPGLIELGRSGLRISRVVFGSMGFTDSSHDPEARIEAMRAAIDAGVTSIDTAPLYGFGKVERLVGQAIAARRHEVQVLTKVGLNWEAPHGQVLFEFQDDHGVRRAVRRNSRPESVRAEVDKSLQRLGVDVLDLVQVHHPDLDTPIPETMGALLELKSQGKLRAIGVSNYSAEQMRVAQAALGDVPLASNQVSYSLLERWPEAEILPLARTTGIGVLAYSPLAQGLLGGAHHRAGAAERGWRGGALWHPSNLARIAKLVDGVMAPLAAAHNCPVADIALAFVLGQPGMSGVVVGASSPAQARRNARAAELKLSEIELGALRTAADALQLDRGAGEDRLSRLVERAKRVARRVERALSKIHMGT
jgi:aryl-alcohol dehydrogenase-like predicted oxidoreductase